MAAAKWAEVVRLFLPAVAVVLVAAAAVPAAAVAAAHQRMILDPLLQMTSTTIFLSNQTS